MEAPEAPPLVPTPFAPRHPLEPLTEKKEESEVPNTPPLPTETLATGIPASEAAAPIQETAAPETLPERINSTLAESTSDTASFATSPEELVNYLRMIPLPAGATIQNLQARVENGNLVATGNVHTLGGTSPFTAMFATTPEGELIVISHTIRPAFLHRPFIGRVEQRLTNPNTELRDLINSQIDPGWEVAGFTISPDGTVVNFQRKTAAQQAQTPPAEPIHAETTTPPETAASVETGVATAEASVPSETPLPPETPPDDNAVVTAVRLRTDVSTPLYAETQNGERFLLQQLPVGVVTPDNQSLVLEDGNMIAISAVYKLIDDNGKVLFSRTPQSNPPAETLTAPGILPTPSAHDSLIEQIGSQLQLTPEKKAQLGESIKDYLDRPIFVNTSENQQNHTAMTQNQLTQVLDLVFQKWPYVTGTELEREPEAVKNRVKAVTKHFSKTFLKNTTTTGGDRQRLAYYLVKMFEDERIKTAYPPLALYVEEVGSKNYSPSSEINGQALVFLYSLKILYDAITTQ